MAIDMWWRVEVRIPVAGQRWKVLFQGPYPGAKIAYLQARRESFLGSKVRLISPAGRVVTECLVTLPYNDPHGSELN